MSLWKVFRVWLALIFCLPSTIVATGQNAAQPVVFSADPLVIETRTGPVKFQIELALSTQQRATGLMFRTSMPENAGMLFDFGKERTVTMWMKNTPLPLDMLFLSETGEIKTIAADTTPYSTTVIPSGEPARYVLEINSGLAEALGIQPGDTAHHPAIKVSETPPQDP